MADETKQVEKQEESTLADEQQETTKANGKKKEADGKYTDAQVNEIINRKFAEWSSKKEKELDEAKKFAQKQMFIRFPLCFRTLSGKMRCSTV